MHPWNTRICAAVFETLSITEVIFRNAVNSALRVWNPSHGSYPPEWTSQAAAPLNSLVSGATSRARTNAGKSVRSGT